MTFKARGHPNIRSTHKTTLMTTKERRLTPGGDCVVAVEAEKGLWDMSDEIKEASRSSDAVITFTLVVNEMEFTALGRGHPGLTYSDPVDIVVRKSGYVCGRTLMVHADKAACDIPQDLVRLLADENNEITVTITINL